MLLLCPILGKLSNEYVQVWRHCDMTSQTAIAVSFELLISVIILIYSELKFSHMLVCLFFIAN